MISTVQTTCFLVLWLRAVFPAFGNNLEIVRHDIHALQSSAIALECNDEAERGNKWKYNEKLLFAGTNRLENTFHGIRVFEQNYSLHLDPVSLLHEGLYRCIRNGTTVRIYRVIVEVKPDIFIAINGSKVTKEFVFPERIVAQCYAHKAKPAVNLTWIISNKPEEHIKTQCNKSENETEKTYDCTTSLNTTISDKNGTLICMSSNHSTFREQVASIVFSVKGSTKKTPSFTEQDLGNKEDPDFVAQKWPIAFITVPVLIIAGIGLYLQSTKRKKQPSGLPPRNHPRINHDSSDNGYGRYQTPMEAYVTLEPPNVQPVSHNQRMSPLDMENITLEERLPGDGFFDCWIAKVTKEDTKVVAKSLSENSQLNQLYTFQEVANAVSSLTEHRNIAAILGTSLTKVPYYIYQEFIKLGTLREYLLKNYQSSRYSQVGNLVDKQNLSSSYQKRQDVIQFCFQIANGMTFLILKKFCHPAISANKVLISSTGICKLYDFWPECSSKLRVDKILDREDPPIAWLAPETVFFRQYSWESDVWSFSVLLWEIYSFGEIPYRGLTNDEIEATLRKSSYLDRPPNCPGAIFNLMLSSWNVSVKERPSFPQLRATLESLGGSLSKDSASNEALITYHTEVPQYSAVNKK